MQLLERIKQFVAAKGYTAATFDANRMQGTPTWAVVAVEQREAGEAGAAATGSSDTAAGAATTPVLRVVRPTDMFIGRAAAAQLKEVALQRAKSAKATKDGSK